MQWRGRLASIKAFSRTQNALIAASFLALLRLSPAYAGPPFVTDDPEPVDYGHVEINTAAIGQVNRSGVASPAPTVDANWGALPDVQIHAGFGVAYADTGQGFQAGYGDTELGLKYRFVHQDDDGWLPEIAFYPIIELPSGDASRGLGAGHFSALLPIWAQKDWDDWTLYGGAGFWQNRHLADRNNWYVGWTLLRKVAEDLQIGGELYRQSATATDRPALSAFNLGGTWDLSETYHVLFSAGRGIENADLLDRFSFYLGIQLTL